MPTIKYQIYINAPIEHCFDLARNIDIHTQTVQHTKEKAIGGVTSGLIEERETVTWEAVHFGIKQRLTAQIIEMKKPDYFVDVMVKGAFHSFHHTHQFVKKQDGTLMVDIFHYKSPLGPIGVLADKLFLEKYMERFIIFRSKELKKIAEGS
ncbi:ligand-binding SRPBCC domain-containing protein [Bacillus pakistanensis]|uniref:Ligand-binding SRPBCC domain-containing protein n=1 Tax=Rossellomorea pakistanensis TaxID=992288 RepID=A0ABS2NBR1_9BACI|nr:SRPBCC family protein [Bacillus pakistanensis]MBM7585302.1 ligand-binding SRPBCC domain-containing protein [Bacillus pakistanensis]